MFSVKQFRQNLGSVLQVLSVPGRTSWPVAVSLAVVIVAMLGLRLGTSTYLPHDDGITMLGATCNQGRYALGGPVSKWVPVAEWQSYWTLGSSCFEQIRTDLAHSDIHPPLYYWLLHAWFLVFGVSIPAALALNMVFVVLTALVIFTACRLLSVPNMVAVAVILTWSLTMASRAAAASARQYALLGLFSALLLVLLIIWCQRRRFGYLLAMIPVIAGGMLTQYLFVLPAAAACVVIGAVMLLGRGYRELIQLAVVYVVAAAVFLCINPDFVQSLRLGGEQAQPLTLVAIPMRIGVVLMAVVETFLPLDPAFQIDAVTVATAVITALVVLPMLVLAARWLLRNGPGWRARGVTDRSLPVTMFLATWLAMIALFVFCVIPLHAMRPLYLYSLTPFLFVALAVAAQRSGAVIAAVSVLFAFQFVGVAISTAAHAYQHYRVPVALPGADAAMILDSDRRGIVPAVMWQLSPDITTYVATQDQLLTDFPDLRPVAGKELYFVSRLVSGSAYGSTAAKREQILQEFGNRGYTAEYRGINQMMGGADVYRLTRR